LLPFAADALALAAPGAAVTELASTLSAEAARANLLRVSRLLTCVEGLAAAGIDVLVLKGAALVLRVYRRFGTRTMADIDILVRPESLDRAVAVLTALGWTPSGRKVSRTRELMRVEHALPFTADAPLSLDVHWRLVNGETPGARDAIWSASEWIDVNGVAVRTPAATDLLFHVLVHAVQRTWDPSPRWLIDSWMLLTVHGQSMAWPRLVQLARWTSTSVRVATALADLDRELAATLPGETCDAIRNVRCLLAADPAAEWQQHELAMSEHQPPYGLRQDAWYHWCQVERLRAADASWQTQPLVVGLVDYVRMKWIVRS
jgi:hypothetical protein